MPPVVNCKLLSVVAAFGYMCTGSDHFPLTSTPNISSAQYKRHKSNPLVNPETTLHPKPPYGYNLMLTQLTQEPGFSPTPLTTTGLPQRTHPNLGSNQYNILLQHILLMQIPFPFATFHMGCCCCCSRVPANVIPKSSRLYLQSEASTWSPVIKSSLHLHSGPRRIPRTLQGGGCWEGKGECLWGP